MYSIQMKSRSIILFSFHLASFICLAILTRTALLIVALRVLDCFSIVDLCPQRFGKAPIASHPFKEASWWRLFIVVQNKSWMGTAEKLVAYFAGTIVSSSDLDVASMGAASNTTECFETEESCVLTNQLDDIEGRENTNDSCPPIFLGGRELTTRMQPSTGMDVGAERLSFVRHQTHHPPHISESDGRDSPSHSTFSIPSYFSLDMSTEENYGVEAMDFYGPFQDLRSNLDYTYHGNYMKSRQHFQDSIVEKLLDGTIILDPSGRVCKTPNEPWIVFTAGVMGAGKSHTIKRLASQGLFPLHSFVVVDPDEIRQHFPEFHLYAKLSPEKAGELTHKEAGYVTEIVTAAALRRGHNVLVDGSLRDKDWYQKYFESLRREYKKLRIAILHVIAPREAVLERARNRAKITGRVVPLETLELSLKQVPVSIKALAPLADFFCELDNSPGEVEITLSTTGVDWAIFRDVWAQTCPWPPDQKGKM